MKTYCISFKLSERSENCYYIQNGNKLDFTTNAGMIVETLDEDNLPSELIDILDVMKIMGTFEYINIRPANAN